MGGDVINGPAKQILTHNPSALNGDDIGGITHLLVVFQSVHTMVSICVVDME
jgi:hypothetical protein